MKASSSEYSFKTDSLLGLQLNGDVTERLDGVAQVVIKDRASVDALDSVELLFLRYRPSRGWAIRAGRTSTDLYMLSEYRDVSYAYLWSRPIPEFYAISSSVAKIDGLDISYILSLEEGSWETKLAYGITHFSLFSQTGLVELDFNHALALTSIYTENDWTMRLAVVSIEVDEIEFLTNELVDGLGKKLAYYALGFQYDHMNWVIESELGYIDSEWGIFQSLYNGYLSVGYRVDEITYYGVLASIAVYVQDLVLAREIIDGLAINDVVSEAELISEPGFSVYSGAQSLIDRQGVATLILYHPFSENVVIGQLKILPNEVFIHHNAKDSAVNQAWMLALLTVVTAVLVSFIVHKTLTSPLNMITNRFEEVKPGEDIKLTMPRFHQKDEIGRLVKGIKALVSSLNNSIGSERNLREKTEILEKKFRLIFEQASAGICLIDNDNILVTANPAFERIIYKSHSIEDAIGLRLTDWFCNQQQLESFLNDIRLRRMAKLL